MTTTYYFLDTMDIGNNPTSGKHNEKISKNEKEFT